MRTKQCGSEVEEGTAKQKMVVNLGRKGKKEMMTGDPNKTSNPCWKSAGLKPGITLPLAWFKSRRRSEVHS